MTELVIIGGGPAGMSAAISAYENGIKDILILERDDSLGGILRQCIHNGFGLHKFKEELTGPEYAHRYAKRVKELGICVKLNTMVLEITEDKKIIHSALMDLTPRERQIIVLRFGLDGSNKELTQKEVADRLGISQSYISRLEKRIMIHLKKELCDKI